MVAGYDGLRITMPSPVPSDDEIDAQIDRMRSLDATVETVDRPSEEGDTVVIDIVGTLDGEEQDGLTTDDYNYEVGSGVITPEVDEQLTGVTAGDELDFDATHPDEDEERQLHFTISVKEVKAKVLPELTDEWAQENSDFETVDEMKADLVERMTTVRKAQGCRPDPGQGRPGPRRAGDRRHPRGAGQRRAQRPSRRTWPCASRPRAWASSSTS